MLLSVLSGGQVGACNSITLVLSKTAGKIRLLGDGADGEAARRKNRATQLKVEAVRERQAQAIGFLKRGCCNFFFSFIGLVGLNLWWENSRNGAFGHQKDPKTQKYISFRPQNQAFFLKKKKKMPERRGTRTVLRI